MTTATATRSTKTSARKHSTAASSNLAAELEGRNHGKALRQAIGSGTDAVCGAATATKSYFTGLWAGFTK
jgi:hypothetical protein